MSNSPNRLRLWFVAEFAIVFVGMAMGMPTYAMLPSGGGIVRCQLWEYYVIEFRRQWEPHNLGPAGGTTALQTLAFHVLLSMIGGLALTAIGWGVGKLRG